MLPRRRARRARSGECDDSRRCSSSGPARARSRALKGIRARSRALASPESNTRLADFATPPADSSELEKATRGSRTLPLRRPTAQRARESNTRLADFATPGRPTSGEELEKATRGSRTCHSVGLQFRARESNTRLADFATRRN
ncbi:hypothetical protein PUN28_020675 [Cardiocondyla obscurior]|uniref:Uncharacterized protein n=1 Tax=Cardiocondyla obscurior TaxID=286306 RepID=A0AAW2E8K8_9HYME